MIINFINPWYLLIIPIVLAFIWFLPLKKSNNFRTKFICVLRSIVSVFLIFAMAGLGIKTYTDTTTTIFVADLSASAQRAENKVADFISEASNFKSDKDYVGVVAFGNNTVVEIAPAKEVKFSSFDSYVEANGTNIEKALKMASSIIEENSEKRIILFSDGNETTGSAIQYANLLKNSNVVVDGVYIENELTKEAQITEINTPNVMDKNVEFDVEILIHSLTDTTSNVKVYKGSELVVNRDVELRSGENRFVFSDVSNLGGGIIYRAEISAALDTLLENNKAYSYTYIDDIPSVLIIENDVQSGREFAKILEGSGVRVQTITQEQVPLSIEQLNLWDCVVMSDVSAENLPAEFFTALDSFVKTTGGGLITLGGENSYALGSYQNTVLNDILPVSMELETEGEKPDLAMVMVIDRSGSMTDASYGVSRISMAKEAAMRAVEALEEQDSIGVVAFDTIPAWAVEIQKVGSNQTGIVEEIGKIQPGGGTSILPALQEAYVKLSETDAKLKHIILLTDGQAERDGYNSLINSMVEEGITLSTIAVGSGADTQLMEYLAGQGGGRYYFSNEFTDLPQIFTKETTLAGKEYINNRTFYPTGKDSSAILSGVESVPLIKGYISTTGKPRADVILQSDEEEPILAAWQYGIGRSVAWTSDGSGQWTDEWLSSTVGASIFRNMVSWSIRGGVTSEVIFSGEIQGDTGTIKAQMPYNDQIDKVYATVISADNVESRCQMESIAPGVYSAEVGGIKEGGYIVSLSMEMKDEEAQVVRGGFVIGYPKEYDISTFVDGREFMERLVSATGGKMIEDKSQIFSETLRSAVKTRDIAPVLIVLALLVFLFEIAVRRMAIISSKMEKLLKGHANKKENQKIKSEIKQQEKVKTNVNIGKEVSKNSKPQSETIKEKEAETKSSTAQVLLRNKKNR